MIQRDRDSELQSYGENEGTQETDDVPPLAASVKTLPEAVELSLKGGLDKDCLFRFARALKAFEITNDRRLPPAELQSAFSLWWGTAKPMLPPDADPDEWRFDFEQTFEKTHAALGANSLEEALRRADASPLPPQAERYASHKLKRLVAVCYQLQLLQGKSPFFLGVRDAAKIGGAKSLLQASAWLAGFVRDGILTEIQKGTRKRATRFRFNMPENAPTAEPGTHKLTKGTPHAEPGQNAQQASDSEAKLVSKPTQLKLRTYDLAERKKALKDLIKRMGYEGSLDDEELKRYKELQKELVKVNTQLAGMA